MKKMFKVSWPVIALLALNACHKDKEYVAAPVPPVAETNKTVFITDDVGRFYATDAITGLVKWWYNTYTINGGGLTSATADKDYAVFHDVIGGSVFCVRQTDGSLAWSRDNVFPYSGICSPLIVNGNVYVANGGKIDVLELSSGTLVKQYDAGWGAHSINYAGGLLIYNTCDGYLVALNPDGSQRWEYRSNNGCYHNNPAIAGDRIFILSSTGKLSALNLSSGTELWSQDISAYTMETPVVYSDGLLFMMDALNWDRIYAFDASSGALNKTYTFPADQYGFYFHAPAVSGDRMYFTSLQGELLCYSVSSGELLWHFALSTPEERVAVTRPDRNNHHRANRPEGMMFVTSPVIANDWLFTAAGNTLFALDLNGRIKWQLPTTGSLYNTPAILSSTDKLYRCGMAGVSE